MKYVVADDHLSSVLMVTKLLQDRMDVREEAISSAKDSESLFEVLGSVTDGPAVVILDLVMPGNLKRLPLLRAVLDRAADIRVVAYSGSDSALLAEAVLDAGAFSYVSKGSSRSVLLEAIKSATQQHKYMDPQVDIQKNQGHPWRDLTPREASVIIMLCKGESVSSVAEALGITNKTVSSHKVRALQKLDLPESAGLTSYLINSGLTYLLDD
ncbi:response regulator transcription factor [Lysobacter sp. ESA13C]|uniref:LuxR C-terminal-related transcriptional regulator n=1 Tax=Lysobacter sp. ESA13C TaxID=2862676 RepID=UPI001CBAE18D|nr:response regulator transcription factor [Lysobacter sp. ESA13C]